MFRKPMRLEKWIAFDGAVGAEVLDAAIDDSDGSEGGTGLFGFDGDDGAADSNIGAVHGVMTLEAMFGLGGTDNQIVFPVDTDSGTRDTRLVFPTDFIDNDGSFGLLPFMTSDSLNFFTSGVSSLNHYFEITQPENGAFTLLDWDDVKGDKGAALIAEYGLENNYWYQGNSGWMAFYDGVDSAGNKMVIFKQLTRSSGGDWTFSNLHSNYDWKGAVKEVDGALRFALVSLTGSTAGNSPVNAFLRSLFFVGDGEDSAIGSFSISIYYNATQLYKNNPNVLNDNDAIFWEGNSPTASIPDATKPILDDPDPVDPDPVDPDPVDPDPVDPDPVDPDPVDPGPVDPDPVDPDPVDPGPVDPDPPGPDNPDPVDPVPEVPNPIMPPVVGGGSSSGGDGGDAGAGDSGDPEPGAGDGGMDSRGDSSAAGDGDAGVAGQYDVVNTYRRENDGGENPDSDDRENAEEVEGETVLVENGEIESAAAAIAMQLAQSLEAYILSFEEDRATLESALSRLQDEYFLRSRDEWGDLRDFLREMFSSGNRELRAVNLILDRIQRQIAEFRDYVPDRRDGMLIDSISELLDSAGRRNAETAALTGALDAVADLLSRSRETGLPLPDERELTALFERTHREIIAKWRERNARSDLMGKELAGAELAW